jgi:hypothetical protein
MMMIMIMMIIMIIVVITHAICVSNGCKICMIILALR